MSKTKEGGVTLGERATGLGGRRKPARTSGGLENQRAAKEMKGLDNGAI